MKNFQNLLDMLSSVVEKNSVKASGFNGSVAFGAKRLGFGCRDGSKVRAAGKLDSGKGQVWMSQLLATSREPPHLVA